MKCLKMGEDGGYWKSEHYFDKKGKILYPEMLLKWFTDKIDDN